MKREKLELVTSWSELRAGVITVVKNCYACGASRCRGMLLKLVPSDDEGDPMEWDCIPACSNLYQSSISPQCVEAGVVYRVIDPDADKAETTETAAPVVRKQVKAGAR